jgi:hypothetical protein
VTGGALSGNRAAEEAVGGSAQETPENERIRPQGVPDAGAGDAAPADAVPLDERPADEGPAEIPVPDPQSPEDEPF